jgi:hypothetical protein
MIPSPIPGMRRVLATRYEQQLPRLRFDGSGSIRLFPAAPHGGCSVHITRENRIILSDPHGLRVFEDVKQTPDASAWFVFQQNDGLSPGIYRLSWLRADGAHGAVDFEVPDTPFHPGSSFEHADGTRNGFTVELIYRGTTEVPANAASVLLEVPFELNRLYQRPAWAIMGPGNMPVRDVSLEIIATHPRAWEVSCLPISSTPRRIDWVVY